MLRKMPLGEWNSARQDLETLRSRARFAGLMDLDEALESVESSLTEDECPTVAAIELAFLAEQLHSRPNLREALLRLSERLYLYPRVQTVLLH
jgi:hypothetical protein